jgi:hypothetical protein
MPDESAISKLFSLIGEYAPAVAATVINPAAGIPIVISKIIQDVAGKNGPVEDLASTILGSPELQLQLKIAIMDHQYRMAKVEQEPNMAQIEVNKIEAAHSSIFVSGWRPFIGWICGISLAWKFLVSNLVLIIISLSGVKGFVMPEIGAGELMPLVLALLGLGGLRTYEKTRNGKK